MPFWMGLKICSMTRGHQPNGFSQLAKSSVRTISAFRFSERYFARVDLPEPPRPSTAMKRVLPTLGCLDRSISWRFTPTMAGIIYGIREAIWSVAADCSPRVEIGTGKKPGVEGARRAAREAADGPAKPSGTPTTRFELR